MRDLKKKLGIALGSGASRGWAHIGVLNALTDAGIRIDLISGTSIGALVGAVYANEDLEDFEKFARSITWRTIVSYIDITLPGSGLISGKKIFKMLSGYFKQSRIESLSIPYCAIAADIISGEEVVIDSGRLSDAVRSSISIPGIFAPYKYEGRFLVDGGVVNPVPVNPVKAMGADIVIAVDLNSCTINNSKRNFKKLPGSSKSPDIVRNTHDNERDKRILEMLEDKYREISGAIKEKIDNLVTRDENPNILETLDHTTHIMQRSITKNMFSINSPDIIIEPQLGDFRLLDFDRADEAIAEGYRLTKENIETLKHLLS